mmetsp:Transcript_39596/g.46280  ORF Transcript_39596/g.46280 Transcript_39596/m.46280 type:complete len:280 (+) Transcript_39596:159-998(+)
MSDLTVGFLGAGMMATALMDVLISTKTVSSPSRICCSDIWEPARQSAASKGISSTPDNTHVCTVSKSAVMLAVKPHIVAAACADVMSVESSALVISIAAGIPLNVLEGHLEGKRVVRVMPNTAVSVGAGACAYALGTHCTPADATLVETLFGAVGIALKVEERLLDAVTGVSGSGPAYVFQFIEALADGGVRSGLPRNIALKLAAQTVKGGAIMVERGGHPGVLKDGVCSPGGTTIAGVEQLELGGLRGTVMKAVKAATKRSLQLGGVSPEDIEAKHGL